MKRTLLLLTALAFACSGCAEKNDKQQMLQAIENHDRAVHIKADGWIRDPYITLGPDSLYYLTGTTPNPGDPREQSEPYNIGLGAESVVGSTMQVWRSPDLVTWEYLGAPYTLKDAYQYKAGGEKARKQHVLWAPELHWAGDCWAMVHCPQALSNLVLSSGAEVAGPWVNPMPEDFTKKHDPSLFRDDDGTWYLTWSNGMVAPIKENFAGLAAEGTRIDPANRKIGHEGTTILKIGGKYVFIGTAWSTDQGRKGSYNLYYCTSDSIYGPYSDRRFLGRFLGHGTPFQDRQGRWWCTAFFNANVPPLDSEGIETRDLSANAQTINEQGVTIVPLEVKMLEDGDVYIRAIDKRYATPGPDEVQKFQ